jgi:hypothetical protein
VKVCVVHCPRFIIRIVLAPVLTFACLESGIAQAQESTAHEPSAAENDPPQLRSCTGDSGRRGPNCAHSSLEAAARVPRSSGDDREGAPKRLRPKFMTVAATFVGLIPIIWTTGAGSDVWKHGRADGWLHLYPIRPRARRRPSALRNLELALRTESRPRQAAAPHARRLSVARRRRDTVSGIPKRRV